MLDFQKYNIKEKKEKQSHKNYLKNVYTYMKFALKIGSFFFLQGNVACYKNEN